MHVFPEDQASADPRARVEASPRISFLLFNYRADAATREALASIRADTRGDAVETIVVDNGTVTSGLAAEPGCTVIASARNLGFAGAVALALPFCGGGYIALLNNDAVLLPVWTDTLSRLLDCDENIGIVGGFEADWHPPHRRRGPPHLCPLTAMTFEQDPPDTDQCVPYVSASNCMVRRSAMPRWDADYFLYYEDVDACADLWTRGYRVVGTAKAGVRRRRNHATDKLGWRKAFYVHRGATA